MTDERCETCRHWVDSGHKVHGWRPDPVRYGECHRQPPEVTSQSYGSGRWPITLLDERCGEYESCAAGYAVHREGPMRPWQLSVCTQIGFCCGLWAAAMASLFGGLPWVVLGVGLAVSALSGALIAGQLRRAS
jgi:hypothetical protein